MHSHTHIHIFCDQLDDCSLNIKSFCGYFIRSFSFSFSSHLFIFFFVSLLLLLLRMKNQIYFQSTTHLIQYVFVYAFSLQFTLEIVFQRTSLQIEEKLIFVVARFLFICRIKLFSFNIFLLFSFFFSLSFFHFTYIFAC